MKLKNWEPIYSSLCFDLWKKLWWQQKICIFSISQVGHRGQHLIDIMTVIDRWSLTFTEGSFGQSRPFRINIDIICLELGTPTEYILRLAINCIKHNGNYWVTLLLWADWEEKPRGESFLCLIEIPVHEHLKSQRWSAVTVKMQDFRSRR